MAVAHLCTRCRHLRPAGPNAGFCTEPRVVAMHQAVEAMIGAASLDAQPAPVRRAYYGDIIMVEPFGHHDRVTLCDAFVHAPVAAEPAPAP